MSVSGEAGPFKDFLDDYFGECDEHLGAVRQALLALEASIGRSDAQQLHLETLFRSFHSVKGLSSMVDLREAELLAHELESYLRRLREGELALTDDGVASLADGVRVLEQVIAARRDHRPIPAVGPVIDRLLTPASGAGVSGTATRAAPVAVAREGAEPRWRVRYVPTPELASAGITVNTVRARLLEAGRLVHASPHVTPEGGVSFEFIVAGAVDEAVRDGWREAGLVVEAYETPAEPETAASGPRPGSASIVAPSHVVRVNLNRLDDIMRIVGDLVIARARLGEGLARVAPAAPAPEWRALQDHVHTIERHLRDLRDSVMRVRLVRVGEIFERMVFVVRDLARERDRRVRLDVHGQATEIDKFLVERLMDPVLHLVRNAVDHGLEAPDERVAAGKPPEGTLALRASTVGESVRIEIEDDGRGIDAEAVAARAQAGGAPVAAGPPDTSALLDVLCAPGFSTRASADRVSGRGVGMAVVRSAVEELGGTLSLDTHPGRGTCFSIQLPLTLAITDALIVSVGGRTFAVPQSAVEEVLELEASAVRQLENNEIAAHRGGVLPIVRLSRVFGLPDASRPVLHVLVTGRASTKVGFAVERVVGQREIVVRPFSDALLSVEGITGATELGDGRAVLIVDPGALTLGASRVPARGPGAAPARADHAVEEAIRG